MSDEQPKKPSAAPKPGAEGQGQDRPAPVSATLGGLADLVKASQASSTATPGGPLSLGGLADLVKADPKPATPATSAPESPFDQKVGSAASQYTFVMNSSDLQDLIGDSDKQRVSVHSAASAGFDSAPRPAQVETNTNSVGAELPAPPPNTRDVAPRGGSLAPLARPSMRAPSRTPMVKAQSRNSNTPILLAVAIGLLFIFLLMRRNAALDVGSRSDPPVQGSVPAEAPLAAPEE